tara:strand:+ start:3532 stop:5667 length:2136 start_codon:yes stop_codon:yes gene_type:complete
MDTSDTSLVDAIDAQTHSTRRIANPDQSYLANKNGFGEYDRYLAEKKGSNKLSVYRSDVKKMLVWWYPKVDQWVFVDDYDEEREDCDHAYAQTIFELMSTPVHIYRSRAAARALQEKSDDKKADSDEPTDDSVQSSDIRAQSSDNRTVQSTDDSAQGDIRAQSIDNSTAACKLDVSSEEDDEPLASRKKQKKDVKKDDNDAKDTQADGEEHDDTVLNKVSHEELKKQLEETEALRKELEDLKQTNDKLVSERDNAVRLHEQYKKSKRKEVTNTKKEAEDAKSQLNEQKQAQLDAEQKAMADRIAMEANYKAHISKLSAAAKGKTTMKSCSSAYEALIQHVRSGYQNCIDKVTQVLSQPAAQPVVDKDFLFADQSGGWTQIMDMSILGALMRLLNDDDAIAKYTFAGNNYETTKTTDPLWLSQKNTHTGVIRKIQVQDKAVDSSTSSSAASAAAAAGSAVSANLNGLPNGTQYILTDAANDILFGDSPIDLPVDFVNKLLGEYSYDAYEQSAIQSNTLAELGELFVSLSNKWIYAQNEKTGPTQTEIFVKPQALHNFLYIAQKRGYDKMRLVMHGSNTDAYNKIKADPIGFSLENAGFNGLVHGVGTYWGLSDHITLGYNTEKGNSSNLPNGTAIIGLILTKKSIDRNYQNKHGGYQTFDSTTQMPYKYFMLSNPVPRTKNCIVMHEAHLQLVLGKVVGLGVHQTPAPPPVP